MTQVTRSHNESLTHTGSYPADTGLPDSPAASSKCEVIKLDEFNTASTATPESFRSLDEIVREAERDSKRRLALQKARKKLTKTVYKDEPGTIRTLRLKKGWSQQELADRAKTKQPYIARIESGYTDIRFSTCLRLCDALGIDLNTLGAALSKQKEIDELRIK